jgi:hypothetical protein
MRETLRRIAGYAGKFIYSQFLLEGGTLSPRDLLDAGCGQSELYETLTELQVGGFIVKVRRGVYRVHNSGGAENHESPVNVVNVEESIRESHGLRISSTSEIEGILERIPKEDEERWARFTKECFLMNDLVKLPGLSRDIIVRIVLSEDLLGVAIPVDMISDWRKGALAAERNGNVKQAWMAFAASVKHFFVKCGCF